MNARQIFELEYGKKSTNFMTPERLALGSINDHVAYELSKGRGFSNQPIFGVSVAVLLDEKTAKTSRCPSPIGDVFPTANRAQAHIDFLRDNWDDDLDILALHVKARG